VLRLLLQNVDAPAVPSVTHLLMGYDVEPGMNAIEDSILLPRQEYSCLTIIERALLHSGCRYAVRGE
jgi:nuclear pore complex protein Nup205